MDIQEIKENIINDRSNIVKIEETIKRMKINKSYYYRILKLINNEIMSKPSIINNNVNNYNDNNNNDNNNVILKIINDKLNILIDLLNKNNITCSQEVNNDNVFNNNNAFNNNDINNNNDNVSNNDINNINDKVLNNDINNDILYENFDLTESIINNKIIQFKLKKYI